MSSKYPKPGKIPRNTKSVAHRPPPNARPMPLGGNEVKVCPGGKWNFYRCKDCGAFFVTVDIHEGVTPFFLGCKAPASKKCPRKQGMASAFYPAPENWPLQVPRRADGEWFMPGEYERGKMAKKYPSLYQHVLVGGLVLRKPSKTTPPFPGGA